MPFLWVHHYKPNDRDSWYGKLIITDGNGEMCESYPLEYYWQLYGAGYEVGVVDTSRVHTRWYRDVYIKFLRPSRRGLYVQTVARDEVGIPLHFKLETNEKWAILHPDWKRRAQKLRRAIRGTTPIPDCVIVGVINKYLLPDE